MLTDDEHEDVHERESERIDGLEAEIISALRPHLSRSSARLSTPKPAVRSDPTERPGWKASIGRARGADIHTRHLLRSTLTSEISAAFRLLGFF